MPKSIKIINKYLQEIGCGGGCGSGVGGGCGISPIQRGGTGTCTDFSDVEDLKYQGDYQTSMKDRKSVV